MTVAENNMGQILGTQHPRKRAIGKSMGRAVDRLQLSNVKVKREKRHRASKPAKEQLVLIRSKRARRLERTDPSECD